MDLQPTDRLAERAREVGRFLGQTPEYEALRRANQNLSEDRDAVALLRRLGELQEQFATGLRRGEAPSEEEEREYEAAEDRLQTMPAYQAVAVAQANFDRVMARVNEEIRRGVESAQQSRIILAP